MRWTKVYAIVQRYWKELNPCMYVTILSCFFWVFLALVVMAKNYKNLRNYGEKHDIMQCSWTHEISTIGVRAWDWSLKCMSLTPGLHQCWWRWWPRRIRWGGPLPGVPRLRLSDFIDTLFRSCIYRSIFFVNFPFWPVRTLSNWRYINGSIHSCARPVQCARPEWSARLGTFTFQPV